MSHVTLENCNEIVPGLYLGGVSAALQTQELVDQGVRAVVCCIRELEFSSEHFHKDLEYYRVDVEDVGREPIELYWPEAAEFMEGFLSKGQTVFVHCRAGVSRSASTVIAYLVLHKGYSLYGAFAQARGRRPVVTPNLGFMEKLCELEASKHGSEPTISIDKYSSWYMGEQLGAIPDVSSGTCAPDVCPDGGVARVPSLALTRMRGAAQKIISLNRSAVALCPKNKAEVDVDLLHTSTDDPVVQTRIDKIRTVLLRHMAKDPELGYCQGMHLAAALFAAAADTQGEAYSRFQVFLGGVRGIWLPDFPLLQAGLLAFEEAARDRQWFQHLRAHSLEPSMYLPQAWLPLFTTWLPLATLAECLELLEGHGFAGVLAMSLATLDHAGEHLLKQKNSGDVLRAVSSLAKRAPDSPTLLKATRAQLPKAAAALAERRGALVVLPYERRGSRVVGKDGQAAPIDWPVLPAWLAEAAAAEVPQQPAAAAAKPAAGERSCLCWGWLLRRGAPERSSTSRLPRQPRKSVKVSEQRQEMANMRRASPRGKDTVPASSNGARRHRVSISWAEGDD